MIAPDRSNSSVNASRHRSLAPLAAAAALIVLCLITCMLVASEAAAETEGFQSQLSTARRLEGRRQLAKAQAAYERAIELAGSTSQRAEALFGLGNLLRHDRQRQAAIETFEKLVSLQPHTRWHVRSGKYLGRLYQKAGKLDIAIEMWKMVQKSPEAGSREIEHALWQQVQLHRKRGQSENAARVAGKLIDKYPDSHWRGAAANVIVHHCIGSGQYQRAAELARTEANRENSRRSLMINVAYRLRQAGKDDMALALADDYCLMDPADDVAQRLVYEIHHDRGRLDQYKQKLQKMAEAEDTTKQKSALLRLADLYQRQQNFDRALTAMDRVLKVFEDDAELLADAGEMSVRAGQLQKATGYYQKALKLQPESRRLRVELGDVYAKLGKPENAMDAWKRAYSYDPQDATSVSRLASHLHRLGRYQHAIDILLAGREASGEQSAFARDLGREYEALLRIDDAVEECVTAMESQQQRSPLSAQRQLQLLASDPTVVVEVIDALERLREEKDKQLPAPAELALGLAYWRSGRREDAGAVFGTLKRQANAGQYLVRAAANLDRAGEEKLAERLYGHAIDAGIANGLKVGAARRRAALLLKDGRWEAALDALQQVSLDELQTNAANTVRLSMADVLVLWSGQPQRAEKLYATVMSSSSVPDHTRHAQWGLADCAFTAGEYEKAKQAYQELVGRATDGAKPGEGGSGSRRSPASAGGQVPLIGPVHFPRPMGRVYGAYQLAEIAFRQEKFEAAVKAYRQLAKRYPDSEYANDALQRVLLIKAEFTGESPAESKYIEALGYVDRGELEKAATILRMIFTLGPQEPLADDAAMLYADALARFGDTDEALAQYEYMADKFAESPLAPEALLRAGRLAAREQEGEDERARALFDRLRKDYPDSPLTAEAELVMDDVLSRRRQAAER